MTSSLRLLRHRDFRLLFLGQSASNLGDQLVIVALALYVTRRTGSATDLGIVLASQSLPLIALVLVGGVWADRLARHRIMVIADAARALLHAVLAASIFAGGATIVELIVIEALFGAARAFFQPAYSGLLPQTVPEAQLQDAQALTSTTANLAILAGPALGAAIVLTVGAGWAFAVDSMTFVVSAALLVRLAPRRPASAGGRRSLAPELRAGWREVRARPWVWATIGAFTGAVLCAYAPWFTLAPSVAAAHYGGAAVFGLLESVSGGGALLGAVVAMSWRPRRPIAIGIALVLLWPAQSLAFAVLAPIVAVGALAFAAGFAFSVFEVWWQTALARRIPAHALSRVSSFDWMGSLALLPLGFALAGPAAAALGARTVLAAGAGITVVLLLAALMPAATEVAEEVTGGSSAPVPGARAPADAQPSSSATRSR